jgi:hypothetical protein
MFSDVEVLEDRRVEPGASRSYRECRTDHQGVLR